MVSALDFGFKGCRFESCHPRILFQKINLLNLRIQTCSFLFLGGRRNRHELLRQNWRPANPLPNSMRLSFPTHHRLSNPSRPSYGRLHQGPQSRLLLGRTFKKQGISDLVDTDGWGDGWIFAVQTFLNKRNYLFCEDAKYGVCQGFDTFILPSSDLQKVFQEKENAKQTK